MVHDSRYAFVTNCEDIPRSTPETAPASGVVEATTLIVVLRVSAPAVTGSVMATGPGDRHRTTHNATTDHRAEHADTDELDGPVLHRAAHPAGL